MSDDEPKKEKPPKGVFVKRDEAGDIVAVFRHYQEGLEVIKDGNFEDLQEQIKRSYVWKRVFEYPNINDQLDAIWRVLGPIIDSQGDQADPVAKAIIEQIREVKRKYPKP